MYKVITDLDTRETTNRPYYFIVEVSSGNCMYLSLDPCVPLTTELEYWGNDNYKYKSIYTMIRNMKAEGQLVILGEVIAEGDTFEQAYHRAKLYDTVFESD